MSVARGVAAGRRMTISDSEPPIGRSSAGRLIGSASLLFGPILAGNFLYVVLQMFGSWPASSAFAENLLGEVGGLIPAIAASVDEAPTRLPQVTRYLVPLYVGTLGPLGAVLIWYICRRMLARPAEAGASAAGKLGLYAIYCLPLAAILGLDFVWSGGLLKVAMSDITSASSDLLPPTDIMWWAQLNAYFEIVWVVLLLASLTAVAIVTEWLRRLMNR